MNSRRGIIGELGERGGMKTVSSTIPLVNMFQYVSQLRSMSKGRAQYSMKFDSYQMVPTEVEKEVVKKYGGSKAAVDLVAQDQEGDSISTSALVLLFGFVSGS